MTFIFLVSFRSAFTSVIEQLKADKVQLIVELDKSRTHAEESKELRIMAQKETNRLKRLMETAEEDKQTFQQAVQSSTGVIESLKTTALQSADEFLNRLRLDLKRYRDR